jgi:hypothetical protein
VLPDTGGWLDQHPHFTAAAEVVKRASAGVTPDGQKGITKP